MGFDCLPCLGVFEVGVLTKLDLAEEQSTAFEALAGEVYPLRLGYTAVVCRSNILGRSGSSELD